jgi:glycosyltransferase involved in cell wall biosynthesis
MRRVMIGTPCYDGRIDTWFADSLLNTDRLARELGIQVDPVYICFDSLIQRARNTIFQLAYDGKYDDLFFIDSDTEWKPEWFFRLLNRPEPMVGAALIKKSDNEAYTIKLVDKKLNYSQDRKLIQVDGIGTGFLKINRFALEKIWEISDKYMSDGKGDRKGQMIEQRMVCDVKVIDGDLVSEDFIISEKWKSLGFKCWIDPTITINHNGNKKYIGDFQKFITKLGYV